MTGDSYTVMKVKQSKDNDGKDCLCKADSLTNALKQLDKSTSIFAVVHRLLELF